MSPKKTEHAAHQHSHLLAEPSPKVPGHLLDPLQFAYQANRSVDYAVSIGIHYNLQHLDCPGTYAWFLFVNFSSAFNTTVPEILSSKLSQFTVCPAICQWITRKLQVKLGEVPCSIQTASPGAPQGRVVSLLP
ncbi:hypothetical protein P4O66_002366 [Electrophorus voltai]|uniref:Reverse transcriptase domain-containing protein n=1 Tax=Electrophorus voltai TaxID=2609070 RepID=A0AAD8Z0A5_9TELE|nr:hypothetical protein P4O66_002366 [Electrophorus voltai]